MAKSRSHEPIIDPRPENLVAASLGEGGFQGLTEDERAMQSVLAESFRKQGTTLFKELRAWREKHPEATLNDAVRALYDMEETREVEG